MLQKKGKLMMEGTY
uniref:Uncharacterized protein n=1 Tax=Rhizophora mucronata TaxID=61149 RepID=A0A2P2QSU0_RHIMU